MSLRRSHMFHPLGSGGAPLSLMAWRSTAGSSRSAFTSLPLLPAVLPRQASACRLQAHASSAVEEYQPAVWNPISPDDAFAPTVASNNGIAFPATAEDTQLLKRRFLHKVLPLSGVTGGPFHGPVRLLLMEQYNEFLRRTGARLSPFWITAAGLRHHYQGGAVLPAFASHGINVGLGSGEFRLYNAGDVEDTDLHFFLRHHPKPQVDDDEEELAFAVSTGQLPPSMTVQAWREHRRKAVSESQIGWSSVPPPSPQHAVFLNGQWRKYKHAALNDSLEAQMVFLGQGASRLWLSASTVVQRRMSFRRDRKHAEPIDPFRHPPPQSVLTAELSPSAPRVDSSILPPGCIVLYNAAFTNKHNDIERSMEEYVHFLPSSDHRVQQQRLEYQAAAAAAFREGNNNDAANVLLDFADAGGSLDVELRDSSSTESVCSDELDGFVFFMMRRDPTWFSGGRPMPPTPSVADDHADASHATWRSKKKARGGAIRGAETRRPFSKEAANSNRERNEAMDIPPPISPVRVIPVAPPCAVSPEGCIIMEGHPSPGGTGGGGVPREDGVDVFENGGDFFYTDRAVPPATASVVSSAHRRSPLSPAVRARGVPEGACARNSMYRSSLLHLSDDV